MQSMPDLGFGEILIIAVVLVALFGSRRLPEMARSLGRSMRAFRAEVRGLHEDDVRGRAEAPATRGPLGDPAAPGAAGPAAPEGSGTAGSQAVGPEADRSSGNTG